jgi:hypothetical protein
MIQYLLILINYKHMLQKSKDEILVLGASWTAARTSFHHFMLATTRKLHDDTQTVQATRRNSMTLTNRKLNLSYLKKNGNFPRHVQTSNTADRRISHDVDSYMDCYLTLIEQTFLQCTLKTSWNSHLQIISKHFHLTNHLCCSQYHPQSSVRDDVSGLGPRICISYLLFSCRL